MSVLDKYPVEDRPTIRAMFLIDAMRQRDLCRDCLHETERDFSGRYCHNPQCRWFGKLPPPNQSPVV